MRANSTVELLEARIAPAGVTVVGKTASWKDWDGDLVTMKWTGSNAPDFTHEHTPTGAVANGIVLDEIILKNSNDAISVSVKAGPAGDGRVDLGYVNATGLPLKSFLAPKASVLEFDCGDTVNAIKSLLIAGYGTVDPAAFTTPGGDGTGKLDGSTGAVSILGDLDYGQLLIGHGTTQPIGSLAIGGSLHGDVAAADLRPGGFAGYINCTGGASMVKIGHDIVGGSVANGGKLEIAIAFKSITVGGDIVGGSNSEAGEILAFPGHGKSGSISVGGSIIGGTFKDAGQLYVDGRAKSITVGGDVLGGSAQDAGRIRVNNAASLIIKGSVIGGTGPDTGLVSADSLASLAIKGSIIGGSARGSGEVYFGNVKSILVGGNLQGGTSQESGVIIALSATGSIVVEGSVVGGAVTAPSADAPAGAIETGFTGAVSIQSITIGGNLVAGSVAGGTLTYNGAVLVGGNLGSLNIGGSIEGTNLFRAFVLVKGETPTKPTKAGNFNALGKLTVGGNVDLAVIASGQDYMGSYGASPGGGNLGAAENPDAGIGAVTIGGNYWHSSLMAGVNDNNTLGVGHDTSDTQSIGEATRTAVLGPVVIKGAVLDDFDSSGVSGFEAERIAKITVGGVTLFKTGAPLKFFDFSQFVFAREIAAI